MPVLGTAGNRRTVPRGDLAGEVYFDTSSLPAVSRTSSWTPDYVRSAMLWWLWVRKTARISASTLSQAEFPF